MRDWGGVQVPDRTGRKRAREQLVGTSQHRTDSPGCLSPADIVEEPALFQPRFASIAYAPGRSEAHVADLGQVLVRGEPLDPVTVAAFGQRWFLLDGHHRMAAYRAKGWTRPVPVRVVHSETSGSERVDWAIVLSLEDNRKNRLSLSQEDKTDAAWRATVTTVELSKRRLAQAFSVGEATIGNMRRTLKELSDLGVTEGELERMSWRGALSALKLREGGGEAPSGNWDDQQTRRLAMKLTPAMETRPTPGQLAAVLENFRPGIIRAMSLALEADDLGLENLGLD